FADFQARGELQALGELDTHGLDGQGASTGGGNSNCQQAGFDLVAHLSKSFDIGKLIRKQKSAMRPASVRPPLSVVLTRAGRSLFVAGGAAATTATAAAWIVVGDGGNRTRVGRGVCVSGCSRCRGI